jgi:hypothetical protein
LGESKEGTTRGIDQNDLIYGKSHTELKEKYHHLKQEVKTAEDNNDIPKIEKAKQELDDFNKYYYEYLKPKGGVRKSIDPITRARNRISKRIERALNELKKHDENAGRHFYNALKPINSYFFSYIPDRHIDWLIE